MPAAFDVETSEFVIARLSRKYPEATILAKAKFTAGHGEAMLRAPGNEVVLQQFSDALQRAGIQLELKQGPQPTLCAPVEPKYMQGRMGKLFADMAEKNPDMYAVIKGGVMTVHMPSAEPSEIQAVLIGALGGDAAPVMRAMEASEVPRWE